jgi:uncharacterized membrane protein
VSANPVPPSETRRFDVSSDSHDAHEGSFSESIPPRERRLAGRLEGFGDIVFGFAVSECALQLPTSNGHVDLQHPFALLAYFATFAILASLWLIYHRMMSGTYRPRGFDLFIPFAYLALVSLVPFGMYGLTHQHATISDARAALLSYLILYAVTTLLSSILLYRNLRRGYFFLSTEDRDHAWKTLMRSAVLCVMMAIAIVFDVTLGPSSAGLFTLLIVVAMRAVLVRYPHAPSATQLRVAPPG